MEKYLFFAIGAIAMFIALEHGIVWSILFMLISISFTMFALRTKGDRK